MDLETAKTNFDSLVKQIIIGKDKSAFFNWLRETYLPATACEPEEQNVLEARMNLSKISDELRSKVPLEGVLDSETIHPPTHGEDAGLTSANTVHLDSFLYGPMEEECLVEEGKIPKSLCSDCGSKNTEEITIISHSTSQERIEYIFRGLLPSLSSKSVLDVGSRLGAVLYGAFYHSDASTITGVELNSDLCAIAEKTVKKHCLNKRVEVKNEDILNVPNLVKAADVIILINVFDWFLQEEDQVKVWRYLKETTSPGTTLVTIPSLESSLADLQTGIRVEEWVSAEEPQNPDYRTDQFEPSEIFLYKVL